MVEINSNNAALLLTQAQVAQMMQISIRQVFELRRQGLLPTVQIGTKVRFLRRDVEGCIERLRTPNGQGA
jgi:excisionase family DNA binding protein